MTKKPSLDDVDISALDPDQLSTQHSHPLPRATLSRATSIMLWILRVYVIIAVPLVIYVFIRGLRD